MIRYEFNGDSYETFDEALDKAIEYADNDDYYDGLKDYIKCCGLTSLLRHLPDDIMCHILDYVSSQVEFYINTIEEPDEIEGEED